MIYNESSVWKHYLWPTVKIIFIPHQFRVGQRKVPLSSGDKSKMASSTIFSFKHIILLEGEPGTGWSFCCILHQWQGQQTSRSKIVTTVMQRTLVLDGEMLTTWKPIFSGMKKTLHVSRLLPAGPNYTATSPGQTKCYIILDSIEEYGMILVHNTAF